MSADLSIQTAEAVERSLVGIHSFAIARKDGPLWDVVRGIFDTVGALLRMAGLHVPTGHEFIELYATTILAVVALPAHLALSPLHLVLLLTHEATHVVQWYEDPAKFPILYLQHREKRAAYEAGAIAQSLAVLWALTGKIPATAEELPHAIVLGYALKPEDIALARSLLEQEVTAISLGVIPNGPARTAIAAIHSAQPDALNKESVALIRHNSAGLL